MRRRCDIIVSSLRLSHRPPPSHSLARFRARLLTRSLAMTADNPSHAADWIHVPSSDLKESYFVYSKPIHKSENDDREYRVIKLENGLQAVLVHDENADKAAAALDVAVGHLSDPDDIPGLAHFCEHLLFMGTKQYPKENDYSEYLAKNGGSSNAYTAASNTCYYFNVGVDAFPGAVSRFASFFHSPLFSPSCTLRELNAVDSENKKNLQHDMWRIFQLNKHLTKPGHPWVKFGTGNKATLTEAARAQKTKPSTNGDKPTNGFASTGGSLAPSPIPSRVASPAPSVSSSASDSDADGGALGRETRRRLIEWWSKEYCAGRMSLTLIGKETLDELTDLAVFNFSPVLNREQEPSPLIPDHPFGPNESGTIIHVKTIMDFYAFELSFPFPYQAPYWQVKPDNFLSHFVGHEGPGSLHAYLKNKGWITSLNAGSQNLGRGFAMFKATIHLTKEGFANYRSALLACYKYLSLLRSSSFPPWIQEEIQSIAAARFRFAEKKRPDKYATWISEHLSWPTPRNLVLSGPQLTWGWDEDIVRVMLDSLTVDTGRVVVMAKDHTVVGQSGPWQKEPWYGTEYTVNKIEEDFANLARQPNDIPELYLPRPNEFIPKNFDVEKSEVTRPQPHPKLIRKTEHTDLWYKKDDQFWVPKAQVMVEIRTPVANDSVQASVMTRLFVDLVRDSLTEYAYDADLAGLNYDLGAYQLGLYISVSGYNDRLGVLAVDVLKTVRNLKVDPSRLAVMKEQLKLNWQNFFLGQSYHLADYFGKYTLADGQYTLVDKLEAIDGITVKKLEEYIERLLSRAKCFALVNGNMTQEEANWIMNKVQTVLNIEALPENEIPHELSLLLPEACNIVVEMDVPNPNQTNGAVSLYCHVGDIADAKQRVAFRLLLQIISEPAYNVLRTKEQLGYIVFASEWSNTGMMGLRILVQSEKDTRYVESRIEEFLVYMRSVIENMSAAEFEEQKNGLIRKWLEKVKNLNEETSRFWGHIESGYLDFHRRSKDAALLETTTKDDIFDIFSKYIDPVSSRRSKLSVHLRPQKPPVLKFSMSAAEAFLVQLHERTVQIDDEQYRAASAGEPPISAVKAQWTSLLLEGKDPSVKVDDATARELLEELDKLVKKYPAAGEETIDLGPDVTFVKDISAFKKLLKVTGPPRPVEELSETDIPLSKY